MVVDMGYWSKVLKRLTIVLLTVLGVYLAFKLAIFYTPFLIAFIISLMIEPIIKWVMKKTKWKRKTSAILVLIVVFAIIIGLLAWGIGSLISEASDLMTSLNGYIEKASIQIQDFISHIDFSKIQIPDNVTQVIQESAGDFLGTVSVWIKNALNGIINVVTSLPIIGIYIAVTFMSLYFICTDKIYMVDQLEHHLPATWVKTIGVHLKELIKILGGYLKAQVTLIFISFVISLIGLYLFHFAGLNVEFPLLAALGIGFVDALPILGSGTVMLPWAVIAALNGDIALGIAILVLWTIMSVVRQLMEPRIVGNHIGIHPIFTLLAMYTGFKFIGILGMFVGPIVLIILKNIFATLLDKGVFKSIFDRT
ncbi:MAG: sporulation integral membrane protein YtvI [Clostridia bacterium]